jgi:N-acetylglutamate synthase
VVTPTALDALMDAGWPALDRIQVDGWVVRRSGGVTQRANSTLPTRSPVDVPRAVARVEQLYRTDGLTPTFQISRAARPGDLDTRLAARGYRLHAPTSVLVAERRPVLDLLPATGLNTTITDRPDEAWVDLWWSVDGRGGPVERNRACEIMRAGPARYASVRDEHGTSAVARLALAEGWGGLYCVSVRPDVRRSGQGRTVIRALLEDTCVNRIWLQVADDNQAARSLYAALGFRRASRYHYRALPS